MRAITPSRLNAYTGGTLDRAGHRREDAGWIAAALASETARFAVFWEGKTLLTGLAENQPRALLLRRPAGDAPIIFLGLQDGAPIFATALQQPPAPLLPKDFSDMRGFSAALHRDDATILATARAMLHWQGQTRFCSVCGAPNISARAGYVMLCTRCGTEHFPRTDAAVIMLVARGERILLGQSHKFPAGSNFYSTLAGFVEPGESPEDAVRRETFEETGIRVGEVRYHSSQPWPFPASLMLGYHAEAVSEEITLDTTEMRDARWFTPAEIAGRKALGFNLPPHDSIARHLIDDWLGMS